jgi:hypothetical protein
MDTLLLIATGLTSILIIVGVLAFLRSDDPPAKDDSDTVHDE